MTAIHPVDGAGPAVGVGLGEDVQVAVFSANHGPGRHTGAAEPLRASQTTVAATPTPSATMSPAPSSSFA